MQEIVKVENVWWVEVKDLPQNWGLDNCCTHTKKGNNAFSAAGYRGPISLCEGHTRLSQMQSELGLRR